MLYKDLSQEEAIIIGKLRKTGACHKQYSLKVNAEEVRLPVRLKKTTHPVPEQAGGWKQRSGMWYACMSTCGTPSQSSACCIASRALSTGFRGSQDSQSGHRPVNITQKMLWVLADWRDFWTLQWCESSPSSVETTFIILNFDLFPV